MVIAILGRQPSLGLAELESLYGAQAITPLGAQAALIDAQVDGARLGGTIKLARPLTKLPATLWPQLIKHLTDSLPDYLKLMPQGKIKIALGAYGLPVSAQQLFRAGLELKKKARQAGRSVRIIPAAENATAPNSAQTLRNGLTGSLGMELLLIKHDNQTWLAQTVWTQDIDDYARRDYGRPKRDAFVGMLPPKLAQIMVNLATAQTNPHNGSVVLDPFCGTGVILQEATLMGFDIYGTDIEPRMIDYTRQNIEWALKNDNFGTGPGNQHYCKLEVGDATTHQWNPSPQIIASEMYLGQPLSGLPSPQKLNEIIGTCNTICSKFLKNIRPQLKTGSRHAIAVPAWRTGAHFRHLPMLDHLEDLGYNCVRFQYANGPNELIYHREDQIVARELLVLTVT